MRSSHQNQLPVKPARARRIAALFVRITRASKSQAHPPQRGDFWSRTPGAGPRCRRRSRRTFLERGFYQPLVQALAERIQATFPQNNGKPLSILDAGCGEGYYAGQLMQILGEQAQLIGVDISKAAMQLSTKRYPAMQTAVASSYDIPLPDDSVDVVIRVFAPASDDEIARVLKPGGLYLWVYPGPQHLFALRELIYDAPQPHGEHMAVTAGLGLEVENIDAVSYPLHLPDAEAVTGLLEMTPYYWSASAEKQQHCRELAGLKLEADFCVVRAVHRPL